MESKHRKLYTALFSIYCMLMLWLLFDRPGYIDGIPYWEQIKSNLNLIPFRTLRLFSGLLSDHRPYLVRAAVVNLFGNVIMFIPLGFFLPAVFEKLQKLWKILLTTTLIITMIEVMQLLTLLGSCDIDDLILNLVGAAIGYGIYKPSSRK